VAEHRWDLESGPPILAFDEQDAVGKREVVDFWLREGAVERDEAHRRVDEVHLVALDDGEVVAVTTAVPRLNAQLRMPMWYYRGFVGAAHRRSVLGVRLGVRGREDLEERFVSGRDRRAGGVVFEVQHPGLRKAFPDAVWQPTDFVFIGENEHGDHVRVHFFPGAHAPPPEGAQGST
jgi:hypothetical protein